MDVRDVRRLIGQAENIKTVDTIEELRQRQYQGFLEESGDTISRSEFETLIWFPGVTDEQVRTAGGLKRALAKQKALGR